MDNTAIEKFDPSKLMDGVRDRIKATFVSLIPDAQWEQLVKAEIDRFFESNRDYSYRERATSDFQKVVMEVLSDITKEKVREALMDYQAYGWENDHVKINDELKKL